LFFQAEDGIRDRNVTGVQTCALPISDVSDFHLVELSDSLNIYENPKHPYTQALLSAVPVPDPDYETNRTILEGDVPNPADPPGEIGRASCRERVETEWVHVAEQHKTQ